jgi:hypothetical protein
VQYELKQLFSYLNGFKRNPDLEVKYFTAIGAATTVIADVPCRVYALYIYRAAPVLASFLKLTNHASTASHTAYAQMYSLTNLAAKSEECMTWDDGLTFATGISAAADTDSSGSTTSDAADRPNGFFLLGAP